jgi:N-acetylglucosaminyldiphosphoundecaprenol N-acetyl-beta-D-mannosaminyltransferase
MTRGVGADHGDEPSAAVANLLGLKLHVVDEEYVIERVTDAVRTRTPLSITYLNPNYVMAAHRDPTLGELINRFDLVLADGWGVVHGARFLGIPIATRLSNDDFGPDLFRLSQANAWRTYLFGSAPGIAERARQTLERLLPGLPVVGTRHGWWDALRGHPGRFDLEDEIAAVTAINEARPDILWVGLPTPLQQRWVTSYRSQLDVPVVITGGAFLDHLTEELGYYPAWALRFHLCWLFKLSLEPRRLWRRYTTEMAHFAILLLMERLRIQRRRSSSTS